MMDIKVKEFVTELKYVGDGEYELYSMSGTLDSQINEWIYKKCPSIMDIKYTCSVIGNDILQSSALVIYRENDLSMAEKIDKK